MRRTELDRASLATIFDRIPTSYDRFRPDYPREAVDTLIALSRVRPAADVLEIGAGTGKLTVPLAERGFAITAVEPGPRMADLLSRRVRRWPSVRIVRSTFEDARIKTGSFDLVVAATSFHWLDPDRRYALVADALRPGGALGLIRNDHIAAASSAAYIEGATPIYQRYAPELLEDLALPMPADPPGFEAEMRASGRFEEVEQRQFAWDQAFTAATLVGMLGTHSEHRALPPRRRSALLREIREFVERDLGGGLVDRYVTSVCVGHVVSQGWQPAPGGSTRSAATHPPRSGAPGRCSGFDRRGR